MKLLKLETTWLGGEIPPFLSFEPNVALKSLAKRNLELGNYWIRFVNVCQSWNFAGEELGPYKLIRKKVKEKCLTLINYQLGPDCSKNSATFLAFHWTERPPKAPLEETKELC